MTDHDKGYVPVTACKTVTNSKTEHTRHGVVRTEVTTERQQSAKGGKRK